MLCLMKITHYSLYPAHDLLYKTLCYFCTVQAFPGIVRKSPPWDNNILTIKKMCIPHDKPDETTTHTSHYLLKSLLTIHDS